MIDPQTLFLILLVITVFGSLVAGFPVAFVLGGVPLIIAGIGTAAGQFDASLLGAIPQRVFAAMTNEILLAVPLFVFMGAMLERSGIASELLDGIGRLFGRNRGGLGYAITIVGAILAASTGIVGATVTTMALLSLPVMLRWGYSPRLASGSICAAGTLGQIIPPSLVLVLLADTMSSAYQKAQLEQGVFAPDTVSIADLFAGAVGPGVLLVLIYLIYQMGVAVVRPDMCPPPPRDETDALDINLSDLLLSLAPPLFLILCVLGSILGGAATPTESAAVGAVGAILLAANGKSQKSRANLALALLAAAIVLKKLVFPIFAIDLTVSRTLLALPVGVFLVLLAEALWTSLRSGVLGRVCTETARLTAMVFLILIGAALLSLVFRGFGGDEAVQTLLTSVPGGPYAALAVVMIVIFFLGFILDFIEIIFVVVPTIAPVLLVEGIDPIWLAVLISLNLQTSFLTPPFGFALFYFRSSAPPAIKTSDIYLGVLPFIFLQILVLLLVAFVPAVSTWIPYAIRP